jgi:hypothetical protein
MDTFSGRRLGDAWIHWSGQLRSDENDSSSRKRIFIGLTFGLLILCGSLIFLIDYLIQPRLGQLHPSLPGAVTICLFSIWGAVLLLFLFMALSVWIGKNRLARRLPKSLPLRFFLPPVYRLGRMIGRSKDQISNSFIHVHNGWIRLLAHQSSAGKILILLPRCLHKNVLNQVRRFSLMRHIPMYVVSGGETARRIVEEKDPDAVIGVACERDLLAGIRDLCPKVQIIGIPNHRPEGPCRNTLINFHELEQAVSIFQKQL